MREIGYEEEAFFNCADCCGFEAGGDGDGDGDGRPDPANRGLASRSFGSEQTFYRWKRQYGGLKNEQVRELKQLTEENTRF